MSTTDASPTDSSAAPVLRYDPTAHYEVETFDVEYRRDTDQPWLARIYRPRGSGPFPTILDVHGGQWTRGDRLNLAYASTSLAASGAVVAAIDFRHAPRWHYPLSLVDINYATRWLKVRAADFNGSSEALGGLGHARQPAVAVRLLHRAGGGQLVEVRQLSQPALSRTQHEVVTRERRLE